MTVWHPNPKVGLRVFSIFLVTDTTEIIDKLKEAKFWIVRRHYIKKDKKFVRIFRSNRKNSRQVED